MKETDLPIPSTYTLLLQSLDGLEDIYFVQTNIIMSTDHILTLDVIPNLPLRRLWNCSVLAYECEIVISDIELSELLLDVLCLSYELLHHMYRYS